MKLTSKLSTAILSSATCSTATALGVLEKLRLNVRSLLGGEPDPELLDLCERILFHNDMKAFGLHQLILLYIDWKKEQS